MLGGHFVYESDGWEAIGEYYGFANADARGGARHSSRAWFVQGGRSIGQWAAYGRLERSALDADDTYFASQRAGRSYRRVVVGTRYALSPSAAVKFELSSTHEPATTQIDVNGAPVPFDAARYRRAAVQYSIAF